MSRLTKTHTYQSSSTCIVFIPANCGRSARVGTEEPLAGLQISPNPVSEHLRVNLPVEATEGATLHLVDSRGAGIGHGLAYCLR